MIRLFRPFARVFELDLRSLALLRISMGAILLADLGVRAADLRVMYSNAGVLSTEQAVDYIGKTGWSLYWYSGSPLYVTILFLIAMTAAICLTLGFRTLLATIVSWVLLVSLHNRLPFVVNGGDVLLRMLLLWSMFLPAGTVWSVDAMHGRGKPEGRTARTGTTVLSVAGMCLVLQLCQVYLFTGLFKMNELWLGFHPWDAILQPNYEIKDLGGVALQRAFAYPSYARPVAQQLLKSPDVLRWVALAKPFLDLLLVLLILSPVANKRVRIVTVLFATAIHLLTEAFLHVGQFGVVAIVAWWALMPSTFWDSRLMKSLLRKFSGTQNESLAASPEPHRQESLSKVICLVLLFVVICWNGASLFVKDLRRSSQAPFRSVAGVCMLWQRWNMFAHPDRERTVFLCVGEQRNGLLVDVVNGDVLTKPISLPQPWNMPNHRWRKLLATLASKDKAKYRSSTAQALLTDWNRVHHSDEVLVRMTMHRFTVSTEDRTRPVRHGIELVIE